MSIRTRLGLARATDDSSVRRDQAVLALDETRRCRAMVDGVVGSSKSAQLRFTAWSEDAVDALLAAVAAEVAEHAGQLAAACVEETGIGSTIDKITKIRFASLDVAASLVGRRGIGVWDLDNDRKVRRIAAPVGIVVGLTPVTNPVATTVFKALICLKARNSLIVSAHRDASGVSATTVDLVRGVLQRYGAPVDLIQDVRTRTGRETTAALMNHPDVALILATGGARLVRAAYSSGTPALGVGPGNAPVWIAPDADVSSAASMVVAGKSFDHGIICGSENNLVVDRSVKELFLAALTDAGAAILSPTECRRVERAVFDREGRLRKSALGKSAQVLAEFAGISIARNTRVLIAPLSRVAVQGPYGGEKLAPLLSLFTAEGDADALTLCRHLLHRGGCGHTAIVHSGSAARHLAFAQALYASRILVNSVGAHGCIGLGNGLSPSLTLGCGTYGNTSTTDNITYTHLLNIKRLAEPLPPQQESQCAGHGEDTPRNTHRGHEKEPATNAQPGGTSRQQHLAGGLDSETVASPTRSSSGRPTTGTSLTRRSLVSR
jgi:acetaldehyde dehydrogenase/alcohol dehydrogenase